MFRKLFDYIQGENEKKSKIEMTAPVLVTVVNDTSRAHMEMNFFVPPSQVATIPTPSRDDVKITKLPAVCVYVYAYGGWQMGLNKGFWKNVQVLKDALEKTGLTDTYDSNAGVFFAGYDSPWRLINRHNEVMVVKKGSEFTPFQGSSISR